MYTNLTSHKANGWCSTFVLAVKYNQKGMYVIILTKNVHNSKAT